VCPAGGGGGIFRERRAAPPRGAWMARVKKIFGFVMLGVAEYYLIKMGQVLL
jgi:thiol:disulfide interchange protein